MADTDLSLDDAIRDAVEKNPPPPDTKLDELLGRKPEEKKPDEKKPEDKKPSEEKKEDVEEVEIDADPEEVKNALVLLRSLGNPAQRAEFLETLAKNSGYDLTKKSEQKELVRDAKAILREKLGDNYEILNGDRLAEAFEEMVAAKVTESTKPVLEKMTRAEQAANNQKAATAMESFFARNNIPEDQREAVSQKLVEKMRTMPATPETHVDTYLDDLYLITHRDRVASKTVKDTVKKINENAKERNSSGDGGNDDRIKRGSRMPSLDEAVRAALRGEKLDTE